MADIICRWRNGTPKTVVELVNAMPHEIMPCEKFRKFMEHSIYGNDFFHTPYQLACQLALYCEAEDGLFYPRFTHDITLEEAQEYLEHWFPKYYIPNPYVRGDGFNDIECPTYVVYSLYKYVRNHSKCTYAEAYKAIFHENATNNNDIVKNYINRYSKVLQFEADGTLTITEANPDQIFKFMDRNNKKEFFDNFSQQSKRTYSTITTTNHSSYLPYLTALRTKPFLLLAGISGTGKSRIVRELAFKSCPEFLRDADGTTPGNYCMIEVKPNWHDSSELLGYYSHISKEYQYTNFIKFLVKAMMFPDVPFFVCLDEMNLAPVEQYFAEFLSVLETRKKVGDRIRTGALVKPEYFAELQNAEGGDGYIFTQWFPEIKRNIPYNIYTNPTLAQVGLTLPDNVFIIGTVNMDDTTHQFSRKVLDRAMTIEMNGGKLSDMFGQSHNLEYLPDEDIWDINKFIPEYVTADEVIAVNPDTAEELKTKLPERLEEINEVLKDTPFVVSYRVLNELVIYTGNLLNDGISIDEAIDEAVNQIVLMKILPRIEGDEDMFIVKGAAENRLEQLAHLVSGATKAKLEEMNNRLSTGFTRFWP